MKIIRSISISSAVIYGAVLFAFWTLVIGIYYWLVGWIFGAQSWFIDMNLANWTGYTLSSLFAILWRMLVNALGGALAGLIVALVYNAVAGVMGGTKLKVE